MNRPLTLLASTLALTACQPSEAPAEQPASTAEAPAAEALVAKAVATDPAAAAGPAARPQPIQLATPPKPAGSVGVTVLPQFDRVTADGLRELNLLVRLEGLGEVNGPRPPVDLALVIDRSGSMSGDKIRDVKTASLQLLDSLQPADTVTLISYSSDVRRHTTRLPVGEGREVLRNHLLGIESGGGTALGPAIIRALDDLEAGLRDDGRLTHVLLLSDGLANEGEQRPEVLGARAAQSFTKGISVSTLGVGLDYNEDLMTKLADQGGGRYHFIKDADAIAGILDDEMKGLVATVARGMELELAPSPGTGVSKVFGYPTTRDGARTAARIGSIGAGQIREVVVRLTLPALTPPSVALGTLSVGYRDITADNMNRRADVPLSIGLAASAAEMNETERAEVTVRVAEVEAAERLEVAARAADRGDFAGARGGLQIAIDDLRRKAEKTPSPKLDKQILELEEARDEVQQARSSASKRKAYTKKYKSKAYGTKKR